MEYKGEGFVSGLATSGKGVPGVGYGWESGWDGSWQASCSEWWDQGSSSTDLPYSPTPARRSLGDLCSLSPWRSPCHHEFSGSSDSAGSYLLCMEVHRTINPRALGKPPHTDTYADYWNWASSCSTRSHIYSQDGEALWGGMGMDRPFRREPHLHLCLHSNAHLFLWITTIEHEEFQNCDNTDTRFQPPMEKHRF